MVRRRTHRPTTPTARAGALVLAAVVALSMITSPVGLVGTASAQAATPVFDKSTLQGFPSTANNPTALEFGPDGRLYVATQGGTVYALTVERAGSNSYQVVDQETITAIKAIPNHDDFGTYVPGTTNRQITGLATGGTAAQPVVYIASSDPEIDVGQDDDDTDTNSGAISRLTLTYNGGQLVDVDHDVLVLGLPRSEENHATNGLDLSADGTTLYAAQGGNTNKGAPSDKFGHTPEFALSAAVLEIDLAAIEADYPAKTLADYDPAGPEDAYPDLTFYYAIPTIGTDDATDGDDLPFGGQDGANMAKLVVGGPVQVYSPGYRNPYDLVVTESGQLYLADHGPNGGWGGHPADATGSVTADATAVTNHPAEAGSFSTNDQLVKVDAGAYGGHAVPVRANPTGADIYDETGAVAFDITAANSPVPPGLVNPVEADYISPVAGPSNQPDPGAPAGSDNTMRDANGDVVLFAPTGAIDEYTASNFDGAMQGDLLQVELPGDIERIQLSADGTSVVSVAQIGNTGGPLGIDAVGDDGPFPGTIWTADHGPDSVTVFEPVDYDGDSGVGTCTGADDASLDEDGDGYDNADELDANALPCSSASTPADFDGDGTSNVNDPDDDNDGTPDTVDLFAVDPDDGTATTLPLVYDLAELDLFGPNGQGWTGVMTNGVDDYGTLYDQSDMTVGGAAEALTLESVSTGDATQNDQEDAFQFGIDPPAEPFVVETTVSGLPAAPANYQGIGVYVGTGDQDNYAKVVVSAKGGNGGVQFFKEVDGSYSEVAHPTVPEVTGPDTSTTLRLTVDPTTDPAPANGVDEVTVTASYAVGDGAFVEAGTGTIPAAWLDTSDGSGLAVGVISTAFQAQPFQATWTDISVQSVAAANNQPPTVDPVADQTVTAGESITVDVGAADPDGAAPSLSLGDAPGFASITDDGDGTGTVTLAPGADVAGTFPVEVVADDGLGTGTATFQVTVDAADGEVVFAVNAGGPAYTAADGTAYQAGADTSVFTGGKSYSQSQPIANTADDTLYQTELYGGGPGANAPAAPDLSVPVEDGTYRVTLQFAELFQDAAGERLFDVAIEGQTELDDYDIYAEVGKFAATDRTYTVEVTDGELSVAFTAEADNAKIGAVLVERLDGADPNQAPTVDPIAPVSVTEGESVAVDVAATDVDGDVPTLSVAGPGFVTLADDGDGTGTLTIAPGAGAAGTYEATVTAADGDANGTATVQITVEAATSPGTTDGEVVLAVNAGGPAYTAADGTEYQAGADTSVFTGGEQYDVTADIAGTDDDTLYQTELYGGGPGANAPAAPNLSAPVEDGTYRVTLKLAELYQEAAGERLFDATVEGEAVLTDYDLYADVGKFAATDVVTTVTVTDGELNVGFTVDVDNAKIGAVLVERLEADSPGGDEPFGVATGAATDVRIDTSTATDAAATLSGDLTLGDNEEATVYVRFWVQGQPETQYWYTGQTVDASGAFQLPVVLSPSTTYVWDALAQSGDGEWKVGDQQTFTTPTGQFFGVGTTGATGVGVESATLTGQLINLGGNAEAQVYFTYWQQGAKASTLTWYTGPMQSSAGAFEATVGVEPDTTYEYRAFGRTPDDQWKAGPIATFTSQPGQPYGVATLSASDVGSDTATLNGEVTGLGDEGSATVYLTYWEAGASGKYWYTGDSQSTPGAFAQTVPVTPETTYEVQALAQSADGTWTAGDVDSFTTPAASTSPAAVSAATLTVTAGAGLEASTYGGGSFVLENTGETALEEVTIDLSTATLPDMVFDPQGTAGDQAAKGLSIDGESGDGVGVVSTADSYVFGEPHNGVDGADGYDVVTLAFVDFEPGETVSFSVDNDPTSIKGATIASQAAGPVSGLELAGATVTAAYSDGTVQTTQTLGDGSAGGAEAILDVDVPAAPSIAVDGVPLDASVLDARHSGATVTDPSQTITVSGPAGADVTLVRVEGELDLSNAPGYDVEAFEANLAGDVEYYDATVGPDGTVAVPVTLTESSDVGGLNYLVAAVADADGPGQSSNVVVLELADPAPSGPSAATLTVTQNGGLAASTYGGGSFAIENTGQTAIESVTIDLSGSLIPDAAFDPDGTAGDAISKGLVVDSESGDGAGVVSTATGDVFSQPHNGVDDDEGYDVLTLAFTDFEPGETVTFSTDIDPTTIKGVSSSGGAGSISGLEIAGSAVTVAYADGTVQTSALFGDGSDGGSVAVLDGDVPPAPTLGVVGVSLSATDFPGHVAATVTAQKQQLVLTGPAGGSVTLLGVAASEPVSDGYDVDAYEVDDVTGVSYAQSVPLGADGEVTLSVTVSGGSPNYFLAVVDGSDGAGDTSEVVILEVA
jgi:hypothetical protein